MIFKKGGLIFKAFNGLPEIYSPVFLDTFFPAPANASI